jgi:hypothetical protein
MSLLGGVVKDKKKKKEKEEVIPMSKDLKSDLSDLIKLHEVQLSKELQNMMLKALEEGSKQALEDAMSSEFIPEELALGIEAALKDEEKRNAILIIEEVEKLLFSGNKNKELRGEISESWSLEETSLVKVQEISDNSGALKKEGKNPTQEKGQIVTQCIDEITNKITIVFSNFTIQEEQKKEAIELKESLITTILFELKLVKDQCKTRKGFNIGSQQSQSISLQQKRVPASIWYKTMQGDLIQVFKKGEVYSKKTIKITLSKILQKFTLQFFQDSEVMEFPIRFASLTFDNEDGSLYVEVEFALMVNPDCNFLIVSHKKNKQQNFILGKEAFLKAFRKLVFQTHAKYQRRVLLKTLHNESLVFKAQEVIMDIIKNPVLMMMKKKDLQEALETFFCECEKQQESYFASNKRMILQLQLEIDGVEALYSKVLSIWINHFAKQLEDEVISSYGDITSKIVFKVYTHVLGKHIRHPKLDRLLDLQSDVFFTLPPPPE